MENPSDDKIKRKILNVKTPPKMWVNRRRGINKQLVWVIDTANEMYMGTRGPACTLLCLSAIYTP
jgi:hypothetical protein